MHSAIFELSRTPLPVERWTEPERLPDWFFGSVCDYAEKMNQAERDDGIESLTLCFGELCSRDGSRITFSPQLRQSYFRESHEYFKKAAEALAETDYEVFSGACRAPAFELALQGLWESYGDRRGIYIYCPETDALQPLDHWLRTADISRPFYVGGAISYHY